MTLGLWLFLKERFLFSEITVIIAWMGIYGDFFQKKMLLGGQCLYTGLHGALEILACTREHSTQTLFFVDSDTLYLKTILEAYILLLN